MKSDLYMVGDYNGETTGQSTLAQVFLDGALGKAAGSVTEAVTRSTGSLGDKVKGLLGR